MPLNQLELESIRHSLSWKFRMSLQSKMEHVFLYHCARRLFALALSLPSERRLLFLAQWIDHNKEFSKKAIGQFIDEVQEKCPTISDRDLSRTVQVLAKLEKSRSGYDLLTQLAACSPDDLDTWMRPADVIGIEVYTGDTAPIEFQQALSGCGSVLIWTKLGR